MSFTVRDLKAPSPQPQRIAGAAEQIDIARQALRWLAHFLVRTGVKGRRR